MTPRAGAPSNRSTFSYGVPQSRNVSSASSPQPVGAPPPALSLSLLLLSLELHGRRLRARLRRRLEALEGANSANAAEGTDVGGQPMNNPAVLYDYLPVFCPHRVCDTAKLESHCILRHHARPSWVRRQGRYAGGYACKDSISLAESAISHDTLHSHMHSCFIVGFPPP